MIQAFTHTVDAETVKSILNTVYAVFLGILFTFFLGLDNCNDTTTPSAPNQQHASQSPQQPVSQGTAQPTGSTTKLKFYVSEGNAIPVALVSIYFLFDWFSLNMTIIRRRGVNHLLVIALTILITCLGGLVILSFVPTLAFYIAFAVYAAAVPWWDLCLKQMMQIRRTYLLWGLFALRIVIAYLFLGVLGINALVRPDDTCTRLHAFLLTCVASYVALKVFRYFVLVQSTKKVPNQQREALPVAN